MHDTPNAEIAATAEALIERLRSVGYIGYVSGEPEWAVLLEDITPVVGDWLADLLAETRALALRTAAEAGEGFLGNETTSEMAWQYLRLCADRESYPLCHCGAPVAYGYDGDPTHHRGMCEDCDAVRCDAYPGACRDPHLGRRS